MFINYFFVYRTHIKKKQRPRLFYFIPLRYGHLGALIEILPLLTGPWSKQLSDRAKYLKTTSGVTMEKLRTNIVMPKGAILEGAYRWVI